MHSIDELIPVPWDLDVTRSHRHAAEPADHVAAHGVPRREVSGLWVPIAEADLVYYDREASPAVREQTIGHELGHLLMNHHLEDRSGGSAIADQLAMAEVNPALIERFLARTGYDTDTEVAAEEVRHPPAAGRAPSTGRGRR